MIILGDKKNKNIFFQVIEKIPYKKFFVIFGIGLIFFVLFTMVGELAQFNSKIKNEKVR